MLNDLLQYPTDKQLEVTDANLAKQKDKDQIYLCQMLQEKKLGLDYEDLRSTCKHEHLPMYVIHVGQDVCLRCDKQAVVSSHYNKFVSRVKRLHYNQRRS